MKLKSNSVREYKIGVTDNRNMENNRKIVLLGVENVTLTAVLNYRTNHTVNNNTVNTSSVLDKDEYNFNALFIFGCLLFMFGVIGNTITAFVIYCDRRLHNATYTVIALLAVTDLLAICMRFVAFFLSFATDNNQFVINHQNMINFFLIGNFVTLNSSNFVIVLLARLRYRLLVYPLHTANITKRQVELQCALAWLASFVLAIPYGCNLMLNLDSHASYIVEFIWTFYLYLSTIIPILTFHCLKVRNIRGTMVASENITHKMATMVAVILSLQVISLLPLFVGQIIILIYMDASFGSLVQCGMLLNHTINPVVFFMFSKVNNCMKKSERHKESLRLTYSCTTEMV